ncbi:MAG: hypothetical protein JWQ49_5881 [Edaphobacter sp.]|nr:hypothetical protein [Edaphobacter sp.]
MDLAADLAGHVRVLDFDNVVGIAAHMCASFPGAIPVHLLWRMLLQEGLWIPDRLFSGPLGEFARCFPRCGRHLPGRASSRSRRVSGNVASRRGSSGYFGRTRQLRELRSSAHLLGCIV